MGTEIKTIAQVVLFLLLDGTVRVGGYRQIARIVVFLLLVRGQTFSCLFLPVESTSTTVLYSKGKIFCTGQDVFLLLWAFFYRPL